VQWRAQGYFTGPTAVQMREVKGGSEGPPQKVHKPEEFTSDALAADFDDDDDEDPLAKPPAKQTSEGWLSSDAIEWARFS
jgi:hypothetical protein